ncbi:hypothetical protein [Pseudomonas syringae]|nr:hypothetical protein [Pseudomonas syringae]
MIASRVMARCPNVYVLRRLIVLLLLLKLAVLLYASNFGLVVFGQGNDADYYHQHATGGVKLAVNSWAGFLRWLNEIGLYSREVVRFTIWGLGAVAVPFLAAAVAVRNKAAHPKEYWCVVLVASLYPTLFYYALDIYRDVLMCCLFLLALYLLQMIHGSKSRVSRFSTLAVLLAVCGVLFLMRPYLGVSLIVSLIYWFLSSVRRWEVWVFGGLYIVGLNLAYASGLLDSIMVYRAKFGVELLGASNLNIAFDSPYWFIPTFLKSVLVQLFGLYFYGFMPAMLFFVESVPLIMGVVYVCRNWRFADELTKFLCVFFVVYGSIWLLGNDNMGTAVRLRMFNYIAILLCVVVIYIRKKVSPNYNCQDR